MTKANAVAHCRQAEEYLRAAEHSLDAGDFNAAAGTAIDAGINAADAVAGMNLGRRWKGPHEQAAQFVAGAGIDGRDVAKELRRLLPLKTQSHYSSQSVTRSKATGCVEAARRAVAVARRATRRA
ncbi:MAG: HEPN domain-containing protein [Ilumatobacteraceae bacterium]